jgi:hypothetical protein
MHGSDADIRWLQALLDERHARFPEGDPPPARPGAASAPVAGRRPDILAASRMEWARRP